MTTRRLYLDNAATSSPKPPEVLEAVVRYATELGGSPGRGNYREAREAGAMLNECRRRINTLIGGSNPNHVIFTLNCSDALNMGIKGVLRPGDHVITTELDHNSILRPLNKLVADGVVTQTRLKCDPRSGQFDLDDLRRSIQPRTRLIAMLHGSNVTGTVHDIAAVGRIAKEHNVLFLVDGAQTLGHLPINVAAMNIDLLAAPGHKGLLGPLGTGFLYIRPGVEKLMTTLREGGTGSVSEFDVQPDFMPDRFEPGSHNTPGILGLSAGIQYILDRGIEKMAAHERTLIDAFVTGIADADLPGLRVYGPLTPGGGGRCGVFSVRIDGYDKPQDLANVLEQQFGILTRAGLHCAPGAHRTIDTLPLGGTTRLSFGPFVTMDDVRYTVESLVKVARQPVSV
jgi:cysteine desulfurase family protein